jgi:hypothetical protein
MKKINCIKSWPGIPAFWFTSSCLAVHCTCNLFRLNFVSAKLGILHRLGSTINGTLVEAKIRT